MSLSEDVYYNVIKKTTLTAIDLILLYDNMVLVGMRKNKPAQNYWYVPGCRTRKGETQTNGIARVASSELGLDIDPSIPKLIVCKAR